MNVLIKNAKIICPNSEYHLKKMDIHIVNGIYKSISKKIIPSKNATIIDAPNAYLSLGWVDIFSNFCEPGYESNETINSGIAAAAAGGYTEIGLVPNTKPCTDNIAQVQFLKNHNALVNLHPLGAVSKKTEGKELAEMMDMHTHGAIAFTDGIKPIQDTGLLLKALQYVKAMDATIIQIPNTSSISANGFINEGVISTQLGLAGQAAIAEELMVQRDIELLKYTNSKLHITGISTAKSISLIKQAKKEGLQITCSCTPYHILFTDAQLQSYDSNYKVIPPLRTNADRIAIIKALKDGTIDAIASHHNPVNWDGKNVEFEYANYGMSTIETVLHSLLSEKSIAEDIELIVALLTKGRSILDMPLLNIIEGTACNATLFSTTLKTNFTTSNKKSLGVNNVFENLVLNGKIIATFNNNNFKIND